MFSTAIRKGLTPEASYPASPFSHYVKSTLIAKRDGNLALAHKIRVLKEILHFNSI